MEPMVSRELLHYIVTALKRHTPGPVLEAAIVAQGWSLADTREALKVCTEKLAKVHRLQLTSLILGVSTVCMFVAYAFTSGQGANVVEENSQKTSRSLATLSTPAFYVATTGSDSNSGTVEQPFATITKARDAIRTLGQDGVTVYVRGGTYEAPEVIFGPSDSGSAGYPNVYQNYPGEYPVFVGGKEITLPAGQTGIITLTLADYGIGSATVYGVSGDGQVKPKARTPNAVTPDYEATDPWAGSFAKVASDVATTGNKTIIKYENGSILDPSTWATPTNARAYIYTGDNYWPNNVGVSAVDSGARTITLSGNTSYDMQYTASGGGQRSFFYMENLPEFIDTPGEWVQVGSTVQYHVSGTTTGTEKLRFATTTYQFNINNSSHLAIKGLSLQDIGRQSQGNSGTPGSPIRITDSDNIMVDGVEMQRTAGLGVEITGASEYITVKNSRFIDTRHTAIRIDTDATGAAYFKPLLSTHVIFENNYISGVGFGGDLQNVGIFANAPGAIVRNNEINNIVRSAIQADLRQVNVTIENNKVSGLMRQARDGGGIYLNTFSQAGTQRSWLGRGARILGNQIEDTGGYGWSAGVSSFVFNTWSFGIYLDDWVSGGLVSNNIVRDSGGSCFLIHGGRDNIFENNICHHASTSSAVFHLDEDPNSTTQGQGLYGEVDPKWTEVQNLNSLGYDEGAWLAAFPDLADVPEVQEFGNIMENNILRKNIFVKKAGTYANTYRYRKLSTTNTFTDNLFFDEGSVAFSAYGSLSAGCAPGSEDWECQASKTFAEWQALGFDTTSQVANPLFTNAAAGDFTLASNSPALSLGFVPITTSTNGVMSVAASVGSVGVNTTSATVGDTITATWTDDAVGEYKTFRHRLVDSQDAQVVDWQATDDAAYSFVSSGINPGQYKVCVEARNDLRVPTTGVASSWGTTSCSSLITLAAVATPTPTSSSSASPTSVPTSAPTSTPKPSKKPSGSTATPTVTTETASPTPQESPQSSPIAEVSPSPSPSASTVASPSQRTEEPTTAPFAPEKGTSNAARVSFGILGLLSALGAITTSSLWFASLRALP
jgi:hypothetical protein